MTVFNHLPFFLLFFFVAFVPFVVQSFFSAPPHLGSRSPLLTPSVSSVSSVVNYYSCFFFNHSPFNHLTYSIYPCAPRFGGRLASRRLLWSRAPSVVNLSYFFVFFVPFVVQSLFVAVNPFSVSSVVKNSYSPASSAVKLIRGSSCHASLGSESVVNLSYFFVFFVPFVVQSLFVAVNPFSVSSVSSVVKNSYSPVVNFA